MLKTDLELRHLVGTLVMVAGLWLVVAGNSANDRLYGMVLLVFGNGILFAVASEVEVAPRHVVGTVVTVAGVVLVLNPSMPEFVDLNPPGKNGWYGLSFVLLGSSMLFGRETYLEVVEILSREDGLGKYLPNRGEADEESEDAREGGDPDSEVVPEAGAGDGTGG